MRYKLTEAHNNDNLKSINVLIGSSVRLGETSDPDGKWPNWIYCYTIDGGSEGWVPIQIIQAEGEYGIAIEDYSANELNVNEGETVIGNRELNGWAWCKTADSAAEGWLPLEKLSPITKI